MTSARDAAQEALDLVGRDPRAALVAADAIVARFPRPRGTEEVRQVATAHRAAGLALRSTGDPVTGERRMRRGIAVAEKGDLPDVAAEVRMSLAFVLLEFGRTRAALAMTDHALGVLRGVRAARVRTIRALVLQRSERTREAFAEYDAALRVLRRAKDASWEARLRHNRALLFLELGDTAPAMADLEWTRSHDLANGQTTDAADALFNMGIALAVAGDIPGALDRLDRAEVEWAGIERPESWLARSDVLLGAGLVDEAARQAHTAVVWLHERGWDRLEAQARLTLAVCRLSSPEPDLADARAQAVTARSMFATQDRREWEALALYVIMKAALLEHPTVRDLDQTVQVASTLRDLGSEAPAADLRITAGRAALERGDLARARTLLGPLASMDRPRQLDVRSRAMFARALLAEADGEDRAADAALRTAWSAVETQRSLMGATELRAGAASHAIALVATGARLAVRSGSAVAAFDWAELGRAAVLRYRPVSAPSDPELARALARLRWVARSEEESRLDGTPDRAAMLAVTRGESDVVRLTRRLAGERPGLTPVRASHVRPRLRGETFVQFLAVGPDLWAITVGELRRPSLTPLGPAAPLVAALDTVSFGLRRALAGFGTGAGRAASRQAIARAVDVLDTGLLQPVAPLLGDSDLVLCPTAILTGVPWSMLGTARGRILRVTPSATVWCQARDGRATRPRQVVAVAGPGLRGAEQEVADVVRLHPGATALVGNQARVSRVLEQSAGATVLHLAAHGRLRTDNPLFSAVELIDGPLTGYDLESLPRVPDSVLLSACSSGAGHATVADETLGLAWTLMGLGTSAVIAPLLPVPDLATRDLMVSVHTQLAAGIGMARALATAQSDADPDDPLAAGVAAAFVAYGA